MTQHIKIHFDLKLKQHQHYDTSTMLIYEKILTMINVIINTDILLSKSKYLCVSSLHNQTLDDHPLTFSECWSLLRESMGPVGKY